jgi:ABC-type antimicrobial peptide transport system permease subunit
MVGILERKSKICRMLRSYFLTAVRNLLRNKLSASINIIGLTVAFTCCVLLFLMVHYEFSYDTFHRNRDRLYLAYSFVRAPDGDRKGQSMAYPVAPTLKAEVPGIVASTAFMEVGGAIRYKGKELDNKDVRLVDNDFFRMFSFPAIAGDGHAPLGALNSVVLSASTASAVFGNESPVGRMVSVQIDGVWRELRVSAVLADAPKNSSLQFEVLARIELGPGYPERANDWNFVDHPVFVELAPEAKLSAVQNVLRSFVKVHHLADDDFLRKQGVRKDENGDYASLRLLPFTAIHFDNQLAMDGTISKPYLYTLSLIAVILLVIACFNFVNLNVARSFTRAKEVGIRKTIGAGRRQIYLQLWAESALLFGIATAIAFVVADLVLPLFNGLFTESLRLGMLLDGRGILIVAAAAVAVSFLAGGYPAWLISRFNAVEVLKGKVSMRRNSLLRSGLITLQFVLASALISTTLVVYRQFEHLRNAPLGFEQESLISIPVKRPENARRYAQELRLRLSNQPSVLGVTTTGTNIGIGTDGGNGWGDYGFGYKDKAISARVINVGYDFLKVLGVQPLEGRDFSSDYAADTSSKESAVIFSESMARQFGEKKMAGLRFVVDSSKPRWHVVGVIPDIRYFTMHSTLPPMTLKLDTHGDMGYILVKVRTDNPRTTIELVQSAYHELEPDNTTGASYVSENVARWYAGEKRLSTIFFIAAGIAIVLSCMGLFALVSLMMEQRRKEIGVRKVLGASVGVITGLLSMNFLRLVLLGFAIATPIAWYWLHRWLDNFLYRSSLSWWIFAVSGLLTLVIALVTVGIQTLRAALANPVRSLRSE